MFGGGLTRPAKTFRVAKIVIKKYIYTHIFGYFFNFIFYIYLFIVLHIYILIEEDNQWCIQDFSRVAMPPPISPQLHLPGGTTPNVD